MKNHMVRAGMAAMGLMLWLTGAAHGDRRAYVWTYEYATQPKGDTEIEYYFTSAVDRLGLGVSSYKHWVELEYGLTEHWDVGLYQMFEQEPGDGYFYYDGWKLRTRYRFSEKGVLPVDPLVYLEYIEEAGVKEQAIEG